MFRVSPSRCAAAHGVAVLLLSLVLLIRSSALCRWRRSPRTAPFLEVLLVVRFGRPEDGRGHHLRHDLAAGEERNVHGLLRARDAVARGLGLRLAVRVDAVAVLRAAVVADLVFQRRVGNRAEELRGPADRERRSPPFRSRRRRARRAPAAVRGRGVIGVTRASRRWRERGKRTGGARDRRPASRRAHRCVVYAGRPLGTWTAAPSDWARRGRNRTAVLPRTARA